MKRLTRLTALLLCAAMLLSLIACGAKPVETVPPTEPPTEAPTEPPIDGVAVYNEAIAPISSAENLELELHTTKTITVGPDTFTLESTQELVFSGLGTENMQAALSEKMFMGELDDSFDEYFANGTLYTTVYDEFNYKGAMTQEEYLARFAPAVLLDAALYGEITAEESNGNIVITFGAPTDAESWSMPEGTEFITASGSATVNADGTLAETAYLIEFAYGASHIVMEVTATPKVVDTVSLTAPADESIYTELSFIEAPRVYDLALMYALSTTSASSILNDTIICQAAGVVRSQQINLNFHGSGSGHVSEVEYNINFYQGADSSTYTQTEHFEDGSYTYSADGSDPEGANVTAADMFIYVQEYMIENIIALDYLASAEATELGGILYLELGHTKEYGDFLNEYICSILFEDEQFLNNYATAYETTSVSSYIAVDQYTGFPTAVGIQYEGYHTIDGYEYQLALQADQSFNLASLNSYEAVTGKTLPETEPEEKATPLFYHVTGENGQEMWLLGTIHVGDERTAYLPQEIYDAFAASDALAVEFDTDAFEEALETDTELLTQVSAAYFYSDGSGTKDHLDEELYDAAIMLLKASGNYNANAEYMKPYLWAQSIDNFRLQQGYYLLADKGMDSRLLKLAREQEKEIRDIESGIFQLQMLTGYSDELQELLLEESVSSTSAEYCAGVLDLYELWCAGDEATLREELSDEVDTSELTEEELAEYEAQKHLYEEYNKAMSYDRNDGMLEVAIEYLESGDVVFYAVGLAHLLNNVNGLVDSLREAGYTVELVEYAQ